MFVPLIAALMLSSTPAKALPACVSNEMTSAWEKISFALWITDYTIPDSSPRAATLVYKGCSKGDEGEETRNYVSEDGQYALAATTNHGGENGATTLTLYRGGEFVRLGTWAHHKVFYKGVGIDQAAVPNGNGTTVSKNVFVIPAGAVVQP